MRIWGLAHYRGLTLHGYIDPRTIVSKSPRNLALLFCYILEFEGKGAVLNTRRIVTSRGSLH